MSVKEIEKAIEHLPKSELSELMTWLEQYYHQIWDEQVKHDSDSGRLDLRLAEVEKEYQAGLSRPL